MLPQISPVLNPFTRFERLAITDPAELRFGIAPKPLVTRRGLTIGGGVVYPELNFTLPPMFVDQTTMPEVRAQYQQIITGALQRAVELEAPGLVVEFETLPPMTENPAWGIELTRILLDAMAEAHAKHGLKSVLRITPERHARDGAPAPHAQRPALRSDAGDLRGLRRGRRRVAEHRIGRRQGGP